MNCQIIGKQKQHKTQANKTTKTPKQKKHTHKKQTPTQTTKQ